MRGRRDGSGPYLEDLLSSPKVMRTQRLYDFLSRYEAILARNQAWQPLDFDGRDVLELGSGPVFGWAPLAIFRGASRYVCVEPHLNPEVAFAPEMIEKYFLPIHKDLCAVYGERMGFDEFIDRLGSRVTVHRTSFLDNPMGDDSADMAFSNSCLEHIFPLDRSMARLRQILRPDGRFLHLVDFGNHRPTRNPFQGMYGVEPSVYLAKYGNKVNLHRAPDILRIFQDSGFNATLTPYYHYREFFDEAVLPYWSNLYSENDLFLKAGLIAGKIA